MLAPGAEGEFVLPRPAAEATATGSMEGFRPSGNSIIAKLKDGACEGTINISFGGQFCGSKTVRSTMTDVVGVVVGESLLAPGETGYYAHNLVSQKEDRSDIVYIGTLNLISSGNNNAILQMPEEGTGSYTAAWRGPCGAVATMVVTSTNPEGVIGVISFSAASGGPGSLTSPYIGSGNYRMVNNSWYSFWGTDADGNYWTSSERLSITVSGDTVTAVLNDTPLSDNRGSIELVFYISE
ncbi:hypothetical protein DSECCO2_500130 [anaerobic digester metagenome]